MYKLLEANFARIVNIITKSDLDENCRLRNGLNVHCLAEIFQYLDSVDLYTLGEMNDFYQQIVLEIVIPTHEINFFDLCNRGVTISEVFERYGKKVQKICFGDVDERQTTEQLVQLIAQHCAPDQLRSVRIISRLAKPINLPNQFRKIEKLQCYGNGELSVTLSESLNYMHLRGISLDPDFDWTQLTSLKEIYLENIRGIDANSFIVFLRKKEPKIKVIHHEKCTFEGFISEISESLATHCGKCIQDYSGVMPENQENMYHFLSEFKTVKKVCLTTDQICGGDLVGALKRLSDINTIEELHIKYSKKDNHRDNCLFVRNPELLRIRVKPFDRLKTVTLSGANVSVSTSCVPFRLIDILSTQVLSNVENLNINYAPMDWNFITFAPKLRLVNIDIYKLRRGIDEAIDIISYLELILHHRNNGQYTNDFIEVKFQFQKVYDLFIKIRNRGDNIRLIMADSLDNNSKSLFQNSLTHNANLYKGVHKAN